MAVLKRSVTKTVSLDVQVVVCDGCEEEIASGKVSEPQEAGYYGPMAKVIRASAPQDQSVLVFFRASDEGCAAPIEERFCSSCETRIKAFVATLKPKASAKPPEIATTEQKKPAEFWKKYE